MNTLYHITDMIYTTFIKSVTSKCPPPNVFNAIICYTDAAEAGDPTWLSSSSDLKEKE